MPPADDLEAFYATHNSCMHLGHHRTSHRSFYLILRPTLSLREPLRQRVSNLDTAEAIRHFSGREKLQNFAFEILSDKSAS